MTNISSDLCPHNFSQWLKLAQSTNQADPFCCSPIWQLSFHDAFCPERRLLIREEANCVLAFAEYILPEGKILLAPIESHWFFGNPLLGSDSVDLLDEMIPFLEKFYKPHFPFIAISGIRPNGTFYNSLKRKFSSKFEFTLYSSGVQCGASLKGGVDGYLSRRSADHRRKLTKYYKRATEMGVSFERILFASGLDYETTYSRILSVELSSWKGIGKCGMAEEPGKDFYKTLLKWLSLSNDARVILAKHEGKDIGFILGGKSGNIYRGQQFSYDEGWRKHSIGNLMQLEQIKWLCEEKASRYDMGPLIGPKMEYKSHWTEKRFKTETWILEKK